MLEEAVDAGELVPGSKGWRQRQTELVERYLANPDPSGAAPFDRIRAGRRSTWLELPGRIPDERELLEHALAAADSDPPSNAEVEAEQAIEPLLWLLDQLVQGVKLTQTGALPRARVRTAVERYPDWWDTDVVGPPYQEAELYPLCVLHDLVDQLKLARRQRATLQLSPKGRVLRGEPQRLLSEVAAALAQDLPTELDLPLARDVLDDESDIGWPLFGLLTPFNGIVLERRTPTAFNHGGRILAAAVLDACAHGPKMNLS